MRNEMGNQSTSGIKEEEKAAIAVPEKTQEVSQEDKLKGQNQITSEDQTNDFQEKAADLSSNYLSTNAPRDDSDTEEQGIQESESTTLQEASRESNNSAVREDYVEQADPSHQVDLAKILPSNYDTAQIHDLSPITRETNEGQAKSSSNSEPEYIVQESKTDDGSTSLVEENQSLSIQDDAEAEKLSKSCPAEEGKRNGDCIDNLVLEESICIENNPSEKNIVIEQCDQSGIEDEIEIDHGNSGYVEVTLKGYLDDISSSSTKTVPDVSSENLRASFSAMQEKKIVNAKEIKLADIETENSQNMPDSVEEGSSDLTVDQLMKDETTSHEDFSIENGNENILRTSSSSDLEGGKVIHRESKEEILVDRKVFVATEKEQYTNTEEVVAMPEIVSISNESSAIAKNDAEETTKNYLVEETQKRKEEPWCRRNCTHKRGISQSFQSFGGETELVGGYRTSQISSANGQFADHPASSFNPLSGNVIVKSYGASEDKNKFTVNWKQHISFEVFINEASTFNAQKSYSQTPNSGDNDQELAENAQMKTGTIAQTETLYNQSSKQIIANESPLLNSNAEESAARLSVDSNPDHPNNITGVQLRKSPSFEFGLPLDAMSEESDQTPLLVRDRSLARTFSGSANVVFQSTMAPSEYGRKTLDYEEIQVEEKTILMERSDSDVSRDSFLNFLKKNANDSKIGDASGKQESSVAEEMALGSPSRELALASVKGNGRRKPRSSLFSACICCSAAIH